MKSMLAAGQTVYTQEQNLPCQVVRYLGGGSQGEVYLAELSGKEMALKWYFPAAASQEQLKALKNLIQKGSPHSAFLWPLAVVHLPRKKGFGYVMPVREARFKSIVDLMKGRISPSFDTLISASLELVQSYLRLHSQGFCYRDISFGNVFFDPHSGEVLICDNDNVGIDGAASAGVIGTPRFMAPEIVTGQAQPSTQTDLFSLAALLFYLFIVHHPLEGAREAAIHCFDLPAMTRLYGREAVFIFDPQDESNRPVPGLHDNALVFWPLYPRFLRAIFTKAFTAGLHDPLHGRVRESEWRAALVRLRDALFACPVCGAENFYDEDESGQSLKCWSCQSHLQIPFRLVTRQGTTLLNADTRLYAHHLDAGAPYDFSTVLAEIVPHPQDKNKRGLKNLSGATWQVTAGSGAQQALPSGRSVSLVDGLRINFGTSEGEVCE